HVLAAQSSGRGGVYQELKLISGSSEVLSVPPAVAAILISVKASVGPYVLVTPNETRRKQLQQIAKKELDDLEQWKKEHRPGPITSVPQRLGGNESEAQVRQSQQMILIQSKYQKKVSKNKCVCLFLELKRKLFL
uniref:Uncharacterized protein n=1 Tax=Serinus canaria TaxID=9135 RepID=A0A8C9NJC7_SERCA